MYLMAKNNNKTSVPLETFLFCPEISYPKKCSNHGPFFSQFQGIEDKSIHCVVFFNLTNALQYSRFIGQEHVVLRAFVHHTAVESLGHELGVKPGAINKHQIHGCFPSWGKGKVYIENPLFSPKPPITPGPVLVN